MGQQVNKWEAETTPATLHDSLIDMVAAELVEFSGVHHTSESESATAVRTFAAKCVAQPQAFLQIYNQIIVESQLK